MGFLDDVKDTVSSVGDNVGGAVRTAVSSTPLGLAATTVYNVTQGQSIGDAARNAALSSPLGLAANTAYNVSQGQNVGDAVRDAGSTYLANQGLVGSVGAGFIQGQSLGEVATQGAVGAVGLQGTTLGGLAVNVANGQSLGSAATQAANSAVGSLIGNNDLVNGDLGSAALSALNGVAPGFGLNAVQVAGNIQSQGEGLLGGMSALDEFLGGNGDQSLIEKMTEAYERSNGGDTGDKTPIIYPLNMDFGRPIVVFTVINRRSEDDGKTVMLPIPQGVGFSDSGEYNSVELGQLGNLAKGVGGIAGAAGKASVEGIDIEKIKNQFTKKELSAKGLQVSEIAAELAAGGTFGAAGQAVGMLSTSGRRILNPNTNTTFTSNSVRSFSFSFTLVGRSEKESIQIRDMHNFFRRNLYPESTIDEANVILDYPSIFNIHFENEDVHKYIPYIYPCYLTSLDTTFNPSAAMYHSSKAPAEVAFSLTFQETRALIRNDIEMMSAGQPKPNFNL